MSEIHQERVARFPRRDSLPPEDKCGLAQSPRRSHFDTAVVLSPEDYDSLLDCRDLLGECLEALRQVKMFADGDIRSMYYRDAKGIVDLIDSILAKSPNLQKEQPE